MLDFLKQLDIWHDLNLHLHSKGSVGWLHLKQLNTNSSVQIYNGVLH